MKQAAHALTWCVAEMERRYKLMSTLGVRNLSGFNQKIADAEKAGQPLKDPLALNRMEIDDRDWLLDFALKLATGRNYRRGILNRLKGVTGNRKIG